ncbi:unnamed protein product, partial [Pylaiella littoralis]
MSARMASKHRRLTLMRTLSAHRCSSSNGNRNKKSKGTTSSLLRGRLAGRHNAHPSASAAQKNAGRNDDQEQRLREVVAMGQESPAPTEEKQSALRQDVGQQPPEPTEELTQRPGKARNETQAPIEEEAPKMEQPTPTFHGDVELLLPDSGRLMAVPEQGELVPCSSSSSSSHQSRWLAVSLSVRSPKIHILLQPKRHPRQRRRARGGGAHSFQECHHHRYQQQRNRSQD